MFMDCVKDSRKVLGASEELESMEPFLEAFSGKKTKAKKRKGGFFLAELGRVNVPSNGFWLHPQSKASFGCLSTKFPTSRSGQWDSSRMVLKTLLTPHQPSLVDSFKRISFRFIPNTRKVIPYLSHQQD